MGTQLSFSQLERELSHDYRNKLNMSEDGVDIQNNFSHVASNFIEMALEGKINVERADIQFNPDSQTNFQFSQKLVDAPEFQAILDSSDLVNVLERFADSANHRFIRVKKNHKKTNSKFK